MVYPEDRRHSGSKVITTRTIPGISKRGHEPMPALRHKPVVDTNLGRAQRKSIAGQGWYNYIEILEHGQHVYVIEETAGPTVRKNKRHATARCRSLVHEVN